MEKICIQDAKDGIHNSLVFCNSNEMVSILCGLDGLTFVKGISFVIGKFGGCEGALTIRFPKSAVIPPLEKYVDSL